MFLFPKKYERTFKKAHDERMGELVSKYMSDGMDEADARFEAQGDAKAYADDVVKEAMAG